MKDSDYIALARERSILLALVRKGEEFFIAGDLSGDPREKIQCEELPLRNADIPQQDIEEIFLFLLRRADRCEKEMSKYKLKKVEEDDDEGPLLVRSEEDEEPTEESGSEGAAEPTESIPQKRRVRKSA